LLEFKKKIPERFYGHGKDGKVGSEVDQLRRQATLINRK